MSYVRSAHGAYLKRSRVFETVIYIATPRTSHPHSPTYYDYLLKFKMRRMYVADSHHPPSPQDPGPYNVPGFASRKRSEMHAERRGGEDDRGGPQDGLITKSNKGSSPPSLCVRGVCGSRTGGRRDSFPVRDGHG